MEMLFEWDFCSFLYFQKYIHVVHVFFGSPGNVLQLPIRKARICRKKIGKGGCSGNGNICFLWCFHKIK